MAVGAKEGGLLASGRELEGMHGLPGRVATDREATLLPKSGLGCARALWFARHYSRFTEKRRIAGGLACAIIQLAAEVNASPARDRRDIVRFSIMLYDGIFFVLALNSLMHSVPFFPETLPHNTTAPLYPSGLLHYCTVGSYLVRTQKVGVYLHNSGQYTRQH